MARFLEYIGQTLGRVTAEGSRQFANGFAKGRVSSDAHSRAPGGRQEDTAQNTQGPHLPAKDEPHALFEDPYRVFGQMGYKERPSSITYETLRQIMYRMPIISAIIHTRVEQMASFTHVSSNRYDAGFRIKLRDADERPTDASRKMCAQFEQFILRTGVTSHPRGRDSFETYIRKVVRDALLFDQNCTEIVPAKNGQPAAFYAVDAANIRIAEGAKPYLGRDLNDETAYVEVYEGIVRAEFTSKEMCFGVRNPSTDIRLCGYGTSELEMVLSTITDMLNALNFNSKAFSEGTQAKGILNIREENIPPARLNQFEQKWNSLLRGEENAWRVPILNAKDGVEWINLQNQTDMSYASWLDFLIKTICSQFAIAPEEINFRYGNQGQTNAMGSENVADKIIDSKERGLRPLLRHVNGNINKHLIWPVSEAVEFEFCGLDAMSREEQADFNNKRVRTFMTLNEIRAEDDRDPLPGGDVVLDGTYLQSMMQQQQQQAQPQQPFDAQQAYGQDDQTPDETEPAADGQQPDDEAQEPPQDADQTPPATLQQSMPPPRRPLRKSRCSVDITI